MQKQKILEFIKWAGFIAGFWIVYFLINELLINPILDALASKVANEFIANNLFFLALLISLLLISTLAVLVIPKSRRVRAYKLILAVSILIVAINAFPIINPWDPSYTLLENIKSVLWFVSSFFSHLSITLLLLSFLEYWILTDLKKPIITNKMLSTILIAVAIVSMLITFGIYKTYPIQLGWII